MRGGIATWLAAFVALGSAGVAAGQATAPAATRPASGVQRVVWGTLLKVEGRTLIVRPRPAPGAVEAPPEVTVELEDGARLIVEGRPAGLEDLRPGMFLDVASFPDRPNRPGYLFISATEQTFPGTILRVEGANVILRLTRAGAGAGAAAGAAADERTVATDAQTRVLLAGGGEGTLDDLKPGMRVLVSPETGTARRIRVRPALVEGNGGGGGAPATRPAAGPRGVMGELVRVEGKNLVVRPGPGAVEAAEVTIPTDETTRFTVDYDPGKLQDLRPGMRISIMRIRAAAGAGEPLGSIVTATSRGLVGTVVRTEGRDVILRAFEPGAGAREVTVRTDAETRIIYLVRTVGGPLAAPPKPTIADLKPGLRVHILPATGTAQKIVVLSAE